MKTLTEKQVDDLLKLKFGGIVPIQPSHCFVSDKTIGKIFGVSGSQVRKIYKKRFEENARKNLPILERLS